MDIRDLVTEAHCAAQEKGWWEKPKSPLECHMLMVSELSEATEEARKGTPPIYTLDCDPTDPAGLTTELLKEMVEDNGNDPPKPEGELIELADTVIRIADYCGFKGWDLAGAIEAKMSYNATRSHRHGGKKY